MKNITIILFFLIGNFVFAQNQDTIYIPDLVFSNYIYEEDTTIEADTTKIYEFALVPEKPEYNGGIKELLKFISENLRLTETDKKNISSTIFVEFIIDRNGKVIYPRIIRGRNTTLNKEILKVIKKNS